MREAHNRRHLEGETINGVFVIAFDSWANYKSGRKPKYLCRCICGVEWVILGSSLTTGNTRSCGCWQKESQAKRTRTHGETGTRIYRIWQAMLSRCRNKNTINYHLYGGRGISVCDRWKKYEAFSEDMGQGYNDGLTLERIDNDGDYSLSNCRWATMAEQNRNKRNNRMIEFDGERLCLTDWAKILGMDQASLSERLEKWPKRIALTKRKKQC